MRRIECAVAAFCFSIQIASAQTPPDYVVRAELEPNGSTPYSAAYVNSGSWSWTDTPSGSWGSAYKELSGSTSGNSMSSTSKTYTNLSINTRIIQTTSQQISVFVKTPGSYNLATSNSIHTEITAPQSGSAVHSADISFFPFGQHLTATVSSAVNNYHMTSSASPSDVKNIGCGASAVHFSGYGTTNYYQLYTYNFQASSDLQGAGATYALAEGTTALTVTPVSYGAPTAVLDGPTVGGTVVSVVPRGSSVTYFDHSYDSDSGSTGAGTGICSRSIVVTRDGATVVSSTASSVTFTASNPGHYHTVLTVTDDEGVQSSTSSDFTVSPHDLLRGGICGGPESDGSCEGVVQTACGGGQGGLGQSSSQTPSGEPTGSGGDDWCSGAVNPGTGGGGVSCHDPIRTRGYPLTNNIHVNSLERFPSLTTAMGNANFTYGIQITPQAVPVYGGTALHWFLIDADGKELDYGLTSGSPAPEAGVFGTLTQDGSLNFTLTGAGAPGNIHTAGNYTYTFTSFGQLTSITDPSGNVQEVQYDTSNLPIEVDDVSSGRSITFEYDTPGLIARVVEAGGDAVTHLSYTSGRLSGMALKDSLGNTIEEIAITYNGDGLPYQVTKDSDSATTLTFTYDSAGLPGVKFANLSWATGGTNFSYFPLPGTGASYRVNRTNAQSATVSYDYDANGNLLKATYPAFTGQLNPTIFTYGYNSSRKLTSWNDTNTTLTLGYTSLGLLNSLDNNFGGVWTYTYSGVDLTGASDSVGTLYSLSYGDSSNPHSPTTITDGASNSWTLAYNSHGQILSVTPPSGSPTGATVYDYEENSSSPMFGYLKSITNGAGDVVTIDSYDSFGDPTSVTTSPSTGTTNTSTFSYDPAQRLLQSEHPDSKTVQYAYTGRDLTSITDEGGSITDLDHCPFCGKLTGISMPLSKALSWDLNGDFEVTSFHDGRNNATTTSYENSGVLKQLTFPDSTAYKYTYFRSGQLKNFVIGSTTKQTFAIDAAGRLSTVKYGSLSTPTITYTYNADGTVSQIVDEVGTRTFTYTANRLPDVVTYNFTANGFTTSQTVDYDYNADQTISAITWKSGSTTIACWTYGYDGAARLNSVSNSFSESTSYAYDGEGKIASQTNSNGTSTEYAYNEDRNWPTSITHKLSGTAFASYALQYDGGSDTVGDLTQVTELDSSVVTYGYDDLYRLTSETRTGTGAYTRSYSYDLAGNVTSLNGSTFAAYDSGNKFSSISGGAFSYDSDGNLKSASYAGFSFGTATFDVRQKPNAIGTESLKYYAEGNRGMMRTSSSSPWTFYIFDGDRLIGEINSSGAMMAYTWGADGLVSERILSGSAKSLWYHVGPQAEVRQLTNSSGTVADSYLYTAYGVALSSTGNDVNNHRYGGKYGYYWDGNLKSHLAGQRWYSASLMRWLTRDPIVYDGNDNPYGYVGENPVEHVDPSGLEDWPIFPPGYKQDWVRQPSPGRDLLDPESGNTWRFHAEDRGHWNHWEKFEPNGDLSGNVPENCLKPWPNQKVPPYNNQSPTDPNVYPQTHSGPRFRMPPIEEWRPYPMFLLPGCRDDPKRCGFGGPGIS